MFTLRKPKASKPLEPKPEPVRAPQPRRVTSTVTRLSAWPKPIDRKG